jgi:LPS sulfotransferase NodH
MNVHSLYAHINYAEIKKEIPLVLADLHMRTRHSDFTRFLVLSRSRTGSTMLRSALDSHPHIVMYGEMLAKAGAAHGLYSYAPVYLEKLRREDPIRFLETIIFRAFPTFITHVGFKLFYYHARNWGETSEAVWHYLQEMDSLHIIHLIRRNSLAMYASRILANQTGEWVSRKSKRASNTRPSTVILDYDSCVKEFEEYAKQKKEAENFFARKPLIRIYYEDLCNDFDSAISQLQSFLEVESHSVAPKTEKQSPGRLSQRIKNYDELRERFQDTPWSCYFDA